MLCKSPFEHLYVCCRYISLVSSIQPACRTLAGGGTSKPHTYNSKHHILPSAHENLLHK